jgi:hypothetical protein
MGRWLPVEVIGDMNSDRLALEAELERQHLSLFTLPPFACPGSFGSHRLRVQTGARDIDLGVRARERSICYHDATRGH